MEDTYTLHVAGLTRELPLCPINDSMDIAAFVMFSDVELTVACAKALIEKCPKHDVIITAEAKGIPLAYEMAKQLNKKYIVARKSIKLYMRDPISVVVKSITTANTQTLYLDKTEADVLRDQRVLIVDDVISTGQSVNALTKLIRQCGGNIVGEAAVLAEGDAVNRDDIIYLEELPLFMK